MSDAANVCPLCAFAIIVAAVDSPTVLHGVMVNSYLVGKLEKPDLPVLCGMHGSIASAVTAKVRDTLAFAEAEIAKHRKAAS